MPTPNQVSPSDSHWIPLLFKVFQGCLVGFLVTGFLCIVYQWFYPELIDSDAQPDKVLNVVIVVCIYVVGIAIGISAFKSSDHSPKSGK